MNTDLKAKIYLHHKKVKLISAEQGNLTFKVGQHSVYRVKGEWSCCAVDKRAKWGCPLNKGKVCSHIKAALYWLKEYG